MASGRYLEWLMNYVNCDANKYGYLMISLFNQEFYWTNPMDENRSEDGKQLRYAYSESNGGVPIDDLVGPCSVLEMIVALARRWQVDISSENGSEDGFEGNFWEIIKNLGLDIFTNDKFEPEKVKAITTFMLDREYPKSGKGGMFPVKKMVVDQKNTEIWRQLWNYLDEKDDFTTK